MTTTAVVLAGGASRRFGADKTVASFRGRPLVRHVVDGLRGLPGLTDVVVAAGSRAHAAALAHVVGPDVTVVPDAETGRGPAAGVAAALAAARGTVACVAPVDAPFVTIAPYLVLLDALSAEDADAALFVAAHGHVEPLHAALRVAPARAAFVAALAAQPDAGPRDAYARLRVAKRAAAAAPAAFFMSANTPDALAALARRKPHALSEP